MVNNQIVAVDIKVDNINVISLTVSTIYGLKTGDIVNIGVFSDVNGFITFSGSGQTPSFSAARWPFVSPIPLTSIQVVTDENVILPFGEINSNIE
ncbi:hypothetical protein [Bacillus toyonensis]|uniref:hypothetical protein n=1 Tax=Bacillus toyonensis TaxID=155322 RepID=UPI0015CF4AE5|nr:hypothetical protein [Bacillus toyonensis]